LYFFKKFYARALVDMIYIVKTIITLAGRLKEVKQNFYSKIESDFILFGF